MDIFVITDFTNIVSLSFDHVRNEHQEDNRVHEETAELVNLNC